MQQIIIENMQSNFLFHTVQMSRKQKEDGKSIAVFMYFKEDKGCFILQYGLILQIVLL